MQVLLVNGSPHEHGCTHRALEEVARTLAQEGIDSRIFWLGAAPVGGCVGCGGCGQGQGCVFDGPVNQLAQAAAQADGLIFGSPVYYAAPSANLCGAMERLFMSAGRSLRFKPAAAVVSARRAGTSAALDRIQKFFTFNSMLVVGSKYWTNVHGGCPADVEQDLEGLQTMRQLGRNMAWVLKSLEAGRAAGLAQPAQEAPIKTSYIR